MVQNKAVMVSKRLRGELVGGGVAKRVRGRGWQSKLARHAGNGTKSRCLRVHQRCAATIFCVGSDWCQPIHVQAGAQPLLAAGLSANKTSYLCLRKRHSHHPCCLVLGRRDPLIGRDIGRGGSHVGMVACLD